MFDSLNYTRFPIEYHLPDSASRDNQFKKGDRVEDSGSLRASHHPCLWMLGDLPPHLLHPFMICTYTFHFVI